MLNPLASQPPYAAMPTMFISPLQTLATPPSFTTPLSSAVNTFAATGPSTLNLPPSAVNTPAKPSLLGLQIANEASQFWNQSSESGPDGGNLACAYMVNKILERTLGHKYGTDPDTVNSVREDLLQRGGHIIPTQQAQPGDLALSFNTASLYNIGGATAHIGIFLTPWLIIANSSQTKRFNQILTAHEFSKLYPYFEVIRPAEYLTSGTSLSQWA